MQRSSPLFDNINKLMSALFDREDQQLNKREVKLIQKNIAAGGSTDGFRYMGKIYSQLALQARARGTFHRLAPSLVLEMESLIKDREVVDFDKGRIRQALALVLKDCHSIQDMRDALPNCMADFLPGRLERTRPEAFTLAENPRSYTQYMELREKIEFYVASRLFY